MAVGARRGESTGQTGRRVIPVLQRLAGRFPDERSWWCATA